MTLIIGHRGASADRPENTREAFAEATRQRSDGVELDVRLGLDGSLVVRHDSTLTDGSSVECSDLATARSVEPRLLTLDEALDSALGVVNVEIKFDAHPGLPAKCVELVERVLAELSKRPDGRFVVSSFDLGVLAVLRSLGPTVPSAMLTMGVPEPVRMLELAVDLGCVAYNPWDWEVTLDLVEQAHERALEVWVWTVNDPDRSAALVEWGVDAIITDRPGALRAELVERGCAPSDPGSEPEV